MTQGDIAKSIGVAISTVQRYEKGSIEKIKIPVVEAIARSLHVEPDWIVGKSDVMIKNKERSSLQISDKNVELIPYPSGRLIPVYGTVPAGILLEAVEDIIEYIEIPEEWLKTGNKYAALKVQGDSMYPKYLEGDTVVLKIQPDCECGEDCIVYVNGYDATLKKDSEISLVPLNPNYAPKTYGKGEIEILGVVKELRRKI